RIAHAACVLATPRQSCLLKRHGSIRVLHSFPTRRSSDLADPFRQWTPAELIDLGLSRPMKCVPGTCFAYAHTNFVILGEVLAKVDRKSTRLNSSHVKSSYAVFCLKKKTWLERSTEQIKES